MFEIKQKATWSTSPAKLHGSNVATSNQHASSACEMLLLQHWMLPFLYEFVVESHVTTHSAKEVSKLVSMIQVITELKNISANMKKVKTTKIETGKTCSQNTSSWFYLKNKLLNTLLFVKQQKNSFHLDSSLCSTQLYYPIFLSSRSTKLI